MKNGKEQKIVIIIVEGIFYDWLKKQEIIYVELVVFEVFDYLQYLEIIYLVKFIKGNGNKLVGVFVLGGLVKVKEGMIFNVLEIG